MSIVTRFKFHFIILLGLSLVLLFCRLGIWQIHRAQEKQSMLLCAQNLAHKNPVFWGRADPDPAPYQHVRLRGHYLNTIILLDNQHHQHEVGYDVFSLFELAQDSDLPRDLPTDTYINNNRRDGLVGARHENSPTFILVDRGFIPKSRLNDALIPKPTNHIQGTVYFPTKNPWITRDIIEKHSKNLMIIEQVDTPLLQSVLQKKIDSFIIRLDANQPNGFIRDWAVVSMSPQKHYAYAFQWFSLALLGIFLCVLFTVKRF